MMRRIALRAVHSALATRPSCACTGVPARSSSCRATQPARRGGLATGPTTGRRLSDGGADRGSSRHRRRDVEVDIGGRHVFDHRRASSVRRGTIASIFTAEAGGTQSSTASGTARRQRQQVVRARNPTCVIASSSSSRLIASRSSSNDHFAAPLRLLDHLEVIRSRRRHILAVPRPATPGGRRPRQAAGP